MTGAPVPWSTTRSAGVRPSSLRRQESRSTFVATTVWRRCASTTTSIPRCRGTEEVTMDAARHPELLGQTVVVVGGSAGIGLETARRARAEGAEIVLTGRNEERLEKAAATLGVSRTAIFDANDSRALPSFFEELAGPVDHVMVTAGGPYSSRLADMGFDEARRALQEHPMLMVGVAKHARDLIRP